MKILYRFGADVIWIFHFLVVFIALFGWLFPSIWYVYMAVLGGTLMSLFAFNYCFLSKWEYDLRRKVDPTLNYEYAYASYYTYRLTVGRLRPQFLSWLGMFFVTASLVISLYFHYFFV